MSMIEVLGYSVLVIAGFLSVTWLGVKVYCWRHRKD